MKFIHDDFLLHTDEARELFHNYAEKQPIIDYHCHLPAREIAEDARWGNVSDLWLGHDHYKWRQMRSNGVDERFVTGDASPFEKFEKYAETMEQLVRNPLFDWSHLELARYFDVDERLCGASARRIFDACNERLKEDWFSAKGLVARSNVEVVCTTDDPVDSLEWHGKIKEDGFATKVLPAWRSDKASKIGDAESWNKWIDALSAAAAMDVATWDDFLEAMAVRHAHFEKRGCVLSDYGLGDIPCEDYTNSEINVIFARARCGKSPTVEEARKFASAWLFEGIKADAKANWTVQIHYGAMRNNNGRLFRALGPDVGADSIGDWSCAAAMSRLFDKLEDKDALPRTIVYPLNPRDNAMVGSLIGNFQHGPGAGRMQLGAAWWFNDHRDGIEKHLRDLSALGLLGRFVGMLTDSRSFISYPRHEYFRRILCDFLGGEMARGDIPHDMEWIGGVVSAISYGNAKSYFGF